MAPDARLRNVLYRMWVFWSTNEGMGSNPTLAISKIHKTVSFAYFLYLRFIKKIGSYLYSCQDGRVF